MNTQFNLLAQYKGETDLDKIANLLKMVNEKTFTGDELCLKTNAKDRKYSITEFVWFKIMQQLKDFGFSENQLRALRKNLVEPFAAKVFAEMFGEFTSRPADYDSLEKKLVSSIDKETMQGLEETRKLLLMAEDTPFINWLSLIMVEYFIRRSDFYLLIKPSGELFVWLDEKMELYHKFGLNELKNQPHVCISINDILKDFMKSENGKETCAKFSFISKDEAEVLRYIREKDLSYLTLRFKEKNKISLIEATENLQIMDTGARYSDHILKNGYQDIVYSTQQGRIVKFQRITKQKLNN